MTQFWKAEMFPYRNLRPVNAAKRCQKTFLFLFPATHDRQPSLQGQVVPANDLQPGLQGNFSVTEIGFGNQVRDSFDF